ncbi:MAG: putative transcriptional regulator [Chlorobi bacterium]|nr:putative transcriptional regulator [Chlorobiota bacterium]
MDVFEIIAEPTRRAMLDMLAQGERTAGEIGGAFPSLTQPAVSRHLKVLRDSGLVEVRSAAQQRIYTLRPERLAEIDLWLDRYRRFWNGRLNALEGHLARIHDNSKPTSKRKPKQ